ncbi:protein hunchback [Toxorhynchites rutilus septentrionalis]|uniref:protein hunchback n=1 Tax=Toxorhynchites rutilus septentrionalis TaxID=329112 RepID=UPI002479F40E|nr:protein hunchback [Toxorhynchites rutilus septentrionalis]
MQNFDSIMNSALPQPQLPAENWYDMTIKSEPLENAGSYNQSFQHQSHHHNPSHQDTPMSHSNPTSPQSVDSMDSMSSRSQYFESKASSHPAVMHGGYNPLGFNPLTPPGYAGMFVPPQQHLARQTTPNRNFGKQDTAFVSSSLTPTHTPPMDVTPPKSPKEVAQTPEKGGEEHSSDCEEFFDGSDDEDGIRKPKINSHGKVKKFKCKQCDFVAVTKLSFWEHTRGHIKPEKMLTCTQCPFVTEYKHHLEYHMRNHDRSKPFQCPKCSYSCVNKSMLNSHMKSHSNVFQYRCADCNYATKYCHSLKLHLRKYQHKPDVVLNVDGTPNPYPIIDVYGTRRGPKTKSQKHADLKTETQQQAPQFSAAPLTPASHQPVMSQAPFTPPSSQADNMPRNILPLNLLRNPLAHMFKNAASNNLPLFPYMNLNFQMFADQQAAIAQLSPNYHQPFAGLYQQADKPIDEDAESSSKSNSSPSSSSSFTAPTAAAVSAATTTLGEELLKQITAAAADSSDPKPESHTPSCDAEMESSPTDYSREQTTVAKPPTSEIHSPSVKTTSMVSKNRRKGRAFKLERMNGYAQTTPMEHSDTEHSEGEPSPVTKRQDQQPQQQQQQKLPTESKETTTTMVSSGVQTNPSRLFRCKYCGISFENDAMYAIHMGYHGYDDVYKCNMCGEKCNDQLGFFLHIAQKAH